MLTETTMDVESTVYANAATTYAGTKPEHWDSGVVAYNTLPASDWNWMWNYVTSNLKEGASDLTSLIDEFVTLGEAIGVTVDKDTSLTDVVNAYVTRIATTSTPGAILSSDEDYYISVDENGYASVNGITDITTAVDEQIAEQISEQTSMVSSLTSVISTMVSEVSKLTSVEDTSIDFESMTQIDISNGVVYITGSTYTQGDTTYDITNYDVYIYGSLSLSIDSIQDMGSVIYIEDPDSDLNVYIDATIDVNVSVDSDFFEDVGTVGIAPDFIYCSSSVGTITFKDTLNTGLNAVINIHPASDSVVLDFTDLTDFVDSLGFDSDDSDDVILSTATDCIPEMLFFTCTFQDAVFEGGTYNIHFFSSFGQPVMFFGIYDSSILGGTFNIICNTMHDWGDVTTSYGDSTTTVSSYTGPDFMYIRTTTISGGTFNVKKISPPANYNWAFDFSKSEVSGGTFNFSNILCPDLLSKQRSSIQVFDLYCLTNTGIKGGTFNIDTHVYNRIYDITITRYSAICLTGFITGGSFYIRDFIGGSGVSYQVKCSSASFLYIPGGSFPTNLAGDYEYYAPTITGGVFKHDFVSASMATASTTYTFAYLNSQCYTYIYESSSYVTTYRSVSIAGGFFLLNTTSQVVTSSSPFMQYFMRLPTSVSSTSVSLLEITGGLVALPGPYMTFAQTSSTQYSIVGLLCNYSSLTSLSTSSISDEQASPLGNVVYAYFVGDDDLPIIEGTVTIPEDVLVILEPTISTFHFQDLIIYGSVLYSTDTTLNGTITTESGGALTPVDM